MFRRANSANASVKKAALKQIRLKSKGCTQSQLEGFLFFGEQRSSTLVCEQIVLVEKYKLKKTQTSIQTRVLTFPMLLKRRLLGPAFLSCHKFLQKEQF